MGLATEILDFYHIECLDSDLYCQTFKTVHDFTMQPHIADTLDMALFFKVVNILKSEEHLISLGNNLNSGHHTIFSEMLLTQNYSHVNSKYGTYDFLVNGFLSIAENFKKSVLPIVVRKKDGTHDIGTGFLMGNMYTLVTARHVVEGAELISIPDLNGNPVKAHSVTFAEDERIDIAFILIENETFANLPCFRVSHAKILDEVMSMGYPPLPGFDAIQIYETSTVNTFIKFSSGKVVGSGGSYLDGLEYLVINAKVKGGNSGSPIINKSGFVVGMVVQIPTDSQNVSQLDKLGYGVVVPTSDLLKFTGTPKIPVIERSVINVSNGFRISN